MNKQKLLGQKLSIARSDPMQNRKRASSGSNLSRGRGTDNHPSLLCALIEQLIILLYEECAHMKPL